MEKKITFLLVLSVFLLSGCGQSGTGDVTGTEGPPAQYWHQVNQDGFGDPNDFYAWAVAVFKNRLYVGTNNITYEPPSLSNGFKVWRTGDGTQWEQVVYNGFNDANNLGTRNMTVSQDHLYVGTMNCFTGAELWRSSDGETWEKVVSNGFGMGSSVLTLRGMAEFLGELFVGTTHMGGGQVWCSPDGTTWEQVNQDGFGDSLSVELSTLQVFQDALYVGAGGVSGAKLWRTRDGRTWERVVNENGEARFWDPFNAAILSMASWQGHLYVGTFSVLTGGEVWRTSDGTHWEQVNEDGFGSPATHYVWRLVPFKDPWDGAEYLYAGTIRFQILGWHGEGFHLYRTRDGRTWTQEIADGFGNHKNYGARTLATFQNRLYLGTATSLFEPGEGCEVWRTDRPCPDEDRDGFSASWCRGPDPDDRDPSVVPELD